MIDPSQSDDWAELARELERDPRPAQSESASPPEAETFAEVHPDDAEAEEPDGAGELLDSPESHEHENESEGDEGAGDGEGEAGSGDGQPGTGRKRRRRRRRRRRGAGQPADIAARAEDSEQDAGEGDEVDEGDGADSETDYEADVAEEIEPADFEAEAAEEAGGELLRELIANWNVPSWDEIVSSLNRPDR
jgi:ribonuclease E